MSKVRAQRRAEREAAAQRARESAERRRRSAVARARRRSSVTSSVRRAIGMSARPVTSASRRARIRRWAPAVALLFVLNVVAWVVWTSWTGRALAAAVTLAVVPLMGIWMADSAKRGPGRYGRRL